MRESGVTEPSTIACDNTHVYIGGANGISRIAWPNGTPEKIDDRTVNGLHIFDGVLFEYSEWGVSRSRRKPAGFRCNENPGPDGEQHATVCDRLGQLRRVGTAD